MEVKMYTLPKICLAEPQCALYLFNNLITCLFLLFTLTIDGLFQTTYFAVIIPCSFFSTRV